MSTILTAKRESQVVTSGQQSYIEQPTQLANQGQCHKSAMGSRDRLAESVRVSATGISAAVPHLERSAANQT